MAFFHLTPCCTLRFEHDHLTAYRTLPAAAEPCGLRPIAGCRAGPGQNLATSHTASVKLPAQGASWFKLDTEAYRGKQDDIYFVDAQTGVYGNGAGKIFKTTDGGAHWRNVLHKPGTYFRTVAMLDANTILAGNIGTDYFPNVSDTVPLYRSGDGSQTWQPVPLPKEAASLKGLCAIDVLHTSYINAGVLAKRSVIHASGRVGGPAWLLRSLDGGQNWQVLDMNPHLAAITDVKFFDEMNGLVIGSDDANVERSHAVIVRTRDGGQTWQRTYTSPRLWEVAWKTSFPSRKVGYVTVQNYDPNQQNTLRVLAKTTDGGLSWREIELVQDHKVREFGVGFVDEQRGWVGTSTDGFATSDGGASWQRVQIGSAVNKIRIVPDGEQAVVFAIGKDVYKFARKPD